MRGEAGGPDDDSGADDWTWAHLPGTVATPSPVKQKGHA